MALFQERIAAVRPGPLALLLCCLCAALQPLHSYALDSADRAPVNAPLDVRLLVDVSGSMAKSDPNGLLSPAVQLFIELLPDSAKAGVWTFAERVEPLVAHEPVTPLWRAQALIKTSKLPTVGLRTAVGEALRQASADGGQGSSRRHLVLLTDGKIDVNDEPSFNAAARNALLREQLPELAKAGFVIHTLALSERGDLAFLAQAARATGGQHQRVTDLQTLPDVLMTLFSVIGPADQVPLHTSDAEPGHTGMRGAGGISGAADVAERHPVVALQDVGGEAAARFLVEPGMSELTLVARLEPGQELTLRAPNGNRFDRYQVPAKSRWHVLAEHEVITLEAPASGHWQLDGVLKANVFTYGQLRIRLLDRPHQVAPGPVQAFALVLEDRGTGLPVDRTFLQLVEFEASIEAPTGKPGAVVEHNEDGSMQVVVADLQGVEQAVLVVDARGPTFERTLRHVFSVQHPVRLELTPATADSRTRLWAALNQPDLNPESVRLAAGVTQAPQPMRWYPLLRAPAGMWSLELPETLNGEVEIVLNVRANYLNKGDFSYRTEPIRQTFPMSETARFSFDGEGQADRPARLAAALARVEAAAAEKAAPQRAGADQAPLSGPPVDPAAAQPQPEAEVLVPLWQAGLGLLVALLMVFAVVWKLRKMPVYAAS